MQKLGTPGLGGWVYWDTALNAKLQTKNNQSIQTACEILGIQYSQLITD